MIRQVGTITLRYLSSRGQHHRRHHSTFSAASPSQHHHSATALCLASFIAAASAVTATADGKGDGQELNNDTTAATAFSTAKNHPLNVSKCEVNTPPSPSSPPTAETASTHKPLSLLRRLIYPHSYLPTPRLLTPQDTVFSYPSLTRGLIQRQKDEQRLCNLLSSTQVVKLRTNNNNNQEKQEQLLQEMNTIIYGVGITSQMRQQFIIQFGCTGYTPDILHHLVTNYADRGIIEIGAGHGQWARALHDHYQKMKNDETDITAADGINNEDHNNSNNGGHHPHRQTRHQTRHSWMLHENKFIVAYDSKESLPLSSSSSLSSMSKTTTSTSRASSLQTSVLPPTQEEIKSYFYNNVRTVNNIEAVTKYAHGRVLLLVYPPPGSMAIDTIHAYINATNNPSNLNHHPNRKHHHHNQYHDDIISNNSSDWKNDIVIYVGEGRGGANANDEFFDYFLGISNNNTSSNKKSSSGSWVLEKVMTVKSCPGGKGYEKLFILQRV